MTKQEFENLKIGDVVKHKNFYTNTTTLKKITSKIIIFHGYKKYKTQIIEINGRSLDKVGDKSFISNFPNLNDLSLHNRKPKKLYKPWG